MGSDISFTINGQTSEGYLAKPATGRFNLALSFDRPEVYDEGAATLSWDRTLAFFKTNLA